MITLTHILHTYMYKEYHHLTFEKACSCSGPVMGGPLPVINGVKTYR